MAFTEEQLAEIGARCSSQRMMEQLPVSIELAEAHQGELGAKFPVKRVDELSAYLVDIKTLFQEQSGGKFDANTGNVDVGATMKVLKEKIRDIISAADNAFEEEPTIRDQFHIGPLGKSVPSILKKAETIITLATKNADELMEWGLEDALTEATTAVDNLSKAGTTQEINVKSLPPKTRKLYATKGRAYLLLKKLNRAAKRAFASNPTLAAKFNLDILNRKGKGGGPGDAPVPPSQA